ncbi:sensor histidine kinase [Microbacterium amylolyticum]|uniref:Two-component system sensor histidine kinase DesK n=1 Tax=Microbacterium amylolyticum TaxID=936337 RepID=A0ABS4ZJ54_9MICO|nr:sensor histidine kinase [Microbacterium amylolyticum]MBP2437321.1 two-component system sensor histidine kinase DesK [Microbacterium amylolyticum]
MNGNGRSRDPWETFAPVFGIVWVVFLFFPISAALRSDAPGRMIAVVLLVLFGVVYIAAFIWMNASESWEQSRRRGLPAAGVLIGLMVGAWALTDIGALGATAFIISLTMFAGPKAQSITIATILLITHVSVLLLSGDIAENWVLFVPPALAYVTTATVRLLVAASERHDAMERQIAVVAERERVARDVHDVLGHSLTVVTVKAELAERLVDIDAEAAKREIAQIRSLSREALAEVRATVAGLRVARLSDELEAARAALSDSGISASIAGEAERVDPRHRIVVAWALREAITNVVRHSRASRCEVTLMPDGIVIEDDGIGTPADVAATGLRGIRERARAAGATLTVDQPATGAGTRVEVRW